MGSRDAWSIVIRIGDLRLATLCMVRRCPAAAGRIWCRACDLRALPSTSSTAWRTSRIEDGLFPAAANTRADRPHAEAGLFNDYLQAMPGVGFRRTAPAFATYGERDLGFKPGERKLILDRLEGTEPIDVTGQFYSSDPGIARKRQMMRD